MSEEFYRIKRLPPYVIAEVNGMRAAARAAGQDIIDLGMGNPDLPPPQHVIDKLCEVAQRPGAHGYSASAGIPGVRKAQANYYGRRFGVELDPETEVVMTMGSKEGLASLATAITGPGDVVLAPNPSYPIHTFGFIIAGATIRSVPTTPDENYWRALERAMAFTVPRPSILIVNYPSNPTAETVDLAFYERLVAWAKENKVWILSDLAYSELYYDGNPTRSILEVPGAKDVAVEFTSMSKTFSMAGWRVGFAVGNPRLIAALKRVKSYLDYGAFTPIQAAACAALNGPQDCVDEIRAIVKGRYFYSPRSQFFGEFLNFLVDAMENQTRVFSTSHLDDAFHGIALFVNSKHACARKVIDFYFAHVSDKNLCAVGVFNKNIF